MPVADDLVITFTAPPELVDLMQRMAQHDDRSRAGWIRAAIRAEALRRCHVIQGSR